MTHYSEMLAFALSNTMVPLVSKYLGLKLQILSMYPLQGEGLNEDVTMKNRKSAALNNNNKKHPS